MRVWAVVATLAACQPPGYHQGSSVDAAGSATHDASSSAQVDAPVDGNGTCGYLFQLFGYGGSMSVWLTGDFVQWAASPGSGAIAMTLGSNAAWSVTRTFMPGTYQYKFIINGTTYIADPTDANVVADGFGGHNSVYVCN